MALAPYDSPIALWYSIRTSEPESDRFDYYGEYS